MHAFCEAAPMLLIQLYLFWQMVSPKEFSDLNKVQIIFMLQKLYQIKTFLLENVKIVTRKKIPFNFADQKWPQNKISIFLQFFGSTLIV